MSESHAAANAVCGIAPEAPPDWERVRALRKTTSMSSREPSGGTSELLIGSTVVAVLLPNHTGAEGSVAVPWTEELQQRILRNVEVNLQWWTDQAARYGHEATFRIVPYLADHPAMQIPYDPTVEGSGRYTRDLMAALGYEDDRASLSELQFAFNEDLREEYQTDWAFIAYIIAGANSFRSNANIRGPSTRLWYAAAQSGLVFAHEVGHIFGLYDQYPQVAPFTWQIEVRGFPNGNADFRNSNSMPSIMKFNWGFDAYAAARLGWIDEVRRFTVRTEPEDAVFEVAYVNPQTGNIGDNWKRFRGATVFHWGFGQQVMLRGVAKTVVGEDVYQLPVWDDGGATLQLEASATADSVFTLRYQATGEIASEYWTYLNSDNALAGENILSMDATPGGRILFGAESGFSLWRQGRRVIFDVPFQERPGIIPYRTAYDIDADRRKERFVVGTQQYEALIGEGDEPAGAIALPFATRGEGDVQAVAFDDHGAIWLGTGQQLYRYTDQGLEDISASHRGQISGVVTALAAGDDGSIWVGGFGRGGNWLKQFFPAAGAWVDHVRVFRDFSLREIRRAPDGRLFFCMNQGYSVWDGAAWRHRYDFLPLPRFTVRDVAFHEGRLAIATDRGLWLESPDGVLRQYSMDNSEIPFDVITGLAFDPEGRLFIGTLNRGAAMLEDRLTTQARHTRTASGLTLATLFPNPFRKGATLRLELAREGRLDIDLIGADGRILENWRHGRLATGQHEWHFPEALWSGLPSGTYYLLLRHFDGERAERRSIQLLYLP
jgi:hypothetical protein